MRVCIVLNASWNVVNFRMGLLKALQADGHQILVVAPEDEYSQLLVEEGFDFYPVNMDSKGANPLNDLSLIRELYRVYKRINPDILLHYTIKPNIYGTLAAHRLKIPMINNVSGLGTVFLKDGLISRLAHSLYRGAFRLPQRVFFQNQDDMDLFLKKRLVKKGPCRLIPGSGINTEHFKPEERKTENVNFTFLLVSRLLIDKGINEFIDAIKLMKKAGVQAHFQVLGNMALDHKRGISKEALDTWIKEGWIEYLGTADDVRPLIHSADCVVLPSYREGTPRTLLEAAGCGKPIVATDVPGCREVVRHGVNGYLCKVRDAVDLAQKMTELVEATEEVKKQMAKNSRELAVSNFDERLVISIYKKNMSELLYGN